MFCQKCGESLNSGAQFCEKCGTPTSKSTSGSVELTPSQETSSYKGKAIWNPIAASNWSLVFSPVFGSYLHALNWRVLGEQDRAKSAMRWFYFSLAIFLTIFVVSIFMIANGADRGISSLGVFYYLIWYFSAGKSQAKYVKETFGKDYPRRSWGKPLLIGVAAIVGYSLFLAVILGMMMV